jgi:hypothetical protein
VSARRLATMPQLALAQLVIRPAMMHPEFMRRAAMMMSEPAIGVAAIMMVVLPVGRRSRLFSESQRPGEHNHGCGKSPNN